MMHKYSLEHLTALQCTPPELVYVAAEAGYDYVGLRTMPLGVPGEPECDIARNDVLMRQTRHALETTGLSVSDVEVVKIAPSIDLRTYERSFAAAAELGVRDVTTSIWTPDFAYACASFDAVCALARPYGLRLNLEFVAIASVKTLAGAVRILRSVDADNVGILLDMYHVHRAGTDLAELDGLPTEWLHFCQLCDAPAAIPGSADAVAEEVRGGRLYLGEGGIDVANVLIHLPEIIYALEIPHLRRLGELGPLSYATRCLETARSYLADSAGSRELSGQAMCHEFERQVVPFYAAADKDSRREWGEVRMVTECLTGVYVADMDLDEWDIDALEGVPDRHAGMSESAGIDNVIAASSGFGMMDAVNYSSFGVALEALNPQAEFMSLVLDAVLDLTKCGVTIDLGLAQA